MTRPLGGVRVLEVAAWTFVPAAGAALADLGADVIKVEPPNGDPQRGLMNLLGSAERPGPNPFVEIPNRGKRGMTIDLATSAGRDLLLEVAATADVFLTSYLPAVRKKLGIELEDLRAANPQIIYVCGHGWGARGPMKDTGGFDLAAGWASAGMAAKMTRPGEEPMFQPAAFFDLQGANTIAGAIGTALFQRERSGVPTEVDVSLLGVGMWTLSPDIMAGPYVGTMPAPDRTSSPNPLTNSYPTSDGRWLYLVCLQADRFWAELCETIGRSELITDERFANMVVRAQNAKACVAELRPSLRPRCTGTSRLTPTVTCQRWWHTTAPPFGFQHRRCSSAASPRCRQDLHPSSDSTLRKFCSNWGTIGTPSPGCASPARSADDG
jgi:crotonobetainyl-CoA:carnitine CoA-transferase CaiB-like acyl-CoA transferase